DRPWPVAATVARSRTGPLVVCRQGPSAENNVGLSTSLRRAYAGDARADLANDGLSRTGYSSKEQQHRSFRFISESSITYSSAESRPGRRPLLRPLRPPRARKRHRAVGASVAQNTAHTVYQ